METLQTNSYTCNLTAGYIASAGIWGSGQHLDYAYVSLPLTLGNISAADLFGTNYMRLLRRLPTLQDI